MRLIATPILSIALAASALLAGCSGGSQVPPLALSGSGTPAQGFLWVADGAPRGSSARFHRVEAPAAVKSGIYVSSLSDTSIFGFTSRYKHGRGPLCTIYVGHARINGIATDPFGNLIVPEGLPYSVAVYAGPEMCGSELGEVADPYGQAASAASLDAATGTIIVGDLVTKTKAVGNIAICTLASGCTSELTSSNITGPAYGVAVAKNGDCWLVSENPAYTIATMTYWSGCAGSGVAVTGFKNSYFGSLSIDKNGNILSMDYGGGPRSQGALWVYSGCNPACKVVGGPFALMHEPLSGALNSKGDTFGVAETAFPYGGVVDIYKYTPTKLTYEYSFDTGFAFDTNGFAYSPALNE